MRPLIIKSVIGGTFIATGIFWSIVAQAEDGIQLIETDVTSKSELRKNELQQKERAADHATKEFINVLANTNLNTSVMGHEAQELSGSFKRASDAIHRLEQTGGLEYGDIHRVAIQNAIALHMQRPGALQADISETIDAYSRYLTETLISQSDDAAAKPL